MAPAIVPILVTQLAAAFFAGAWRPVFFILAIPGFLCIWILWKYVSDSPKAMFQQGKVSKEEYDMIVSSVDVDVSEHGREYKSSLYAKDIQFYLYTIGLVIMLMIYWCTPICTDFSPDCCRVIALP